MSISVRLFVRTHANVSQEPHVRTSPNFLCMLPVAMSQLSLGSVTIHHEPSVLGMTSCLYIMDSPSFLLSSAVEQVLDIPLLYLDSMARAMQVGFKLRVTYQG